MKLSQFKFNLPEELIAIFPPDDRDKSKLMVLNRKTGEIEHHIFKDIINYYDDGDMFIFNDTKVFPAKLYGNKEKTGATIEVDLLRELNAENHLWDVLVSPARKIRIGNKLYFGEDESVVAEVIDNTTSRGRTLRFLYDGKSEDFKQILYALGGTPIPDYIKERREEEKIEITDEIKKNDIERYQTIFAKEEGAVVAPATGFHFSRELLKRFEIKGIESSFITLHSGRGNYREIDVEDLTKHKMDSEELIVPAVTITAVNKAIDRGNKVCAVGTSVMRAIETIVPTDGHLKENKGWTNKFIFPPYDFNIATSLVTNFNLPKTTQLMMAAAFGGYDNVMNAYEVAIKEGYKFGAYGDALLII